MSRCAPKVPIEDFKEVLWPRVDLSVVFPKSLTCEEVSVFGLNDNNFRLLLNILGFGVKMPKIVGFGDSAFMTTTATKALQNRKFNYQNISGYARAIVHFLAVRCKTTT